MGFRGLEPERQVAPEPQCHGCLSVKRFGAFEGRLAPRNIHSTAQLWRRRAAQGEAGGAEGLGRLCRRRGCWEGRPVLGVLDSLY